MKLAEVNKKIISGHYKLIFTGLAATSVKKSIQYERMAAGKCTDKKLYNHLTRK